MKKLRIAILNTKIIKKYTWLFNRLASMGPREILHRVFEQKRRYFGKKMQGNDGFLLPDGLLPTIDINDSELKNLANILEKDWQQQLDISANGTWTFLGTSWLGHLDNNIWFLDPITKKQWESKDYCFDIPFRHKKNIGDVKYVWELNRLQFLPPIAALAKSKNDETALNYCLKTIESWIDANPPFKGINWVSGIELAIRSISIILTISLLGESKIPKPLAQKIRTTLNAHAMWLNRFPSRFSSANNHLIAEAAALYIIGLTMPDLNKAKHYCDYGFNTLVSEIEKQILPDGVGAEQSPTYTAFTLEWYLLALAFAKNTDRAFPNSVIDRLQKAGEYLRWITDKAGNQPRIGDDDEGRVICSSPTLEKNYVSNIMASLSVATKNSNIAPPATQPHLRDLFFGSAPLCPTAPLGIKSFDEGGYSIFRQNIAGRESMLVFDHAPLGYLSIAAHGHADALSVWLHIDGQPILIDSGTYLYHSGGAMRDYFRSTCAHNTLSINDENQSKISGAFNWSQKAKSWRLLNEKAGEQSNIIAQHNGYKKRFGLIHQRTVSFKKPNKYIIVDELIGKPNSKEITATIRYFLSPDIDIVQSAKNRVNISIDNSSLLEMSFSYKDSNDICSVTIEDVDISPQFGVKVKGKCIVARLDNHHNKTSHCLNTQISIIKRDGRIK